MLNLIIPIPENLQGLSPLSAVFSFWYLWLIMVGFLVYFFHLWLWDQFLNFTCGISAVPNRACFAPEEWWLLSLKTKAGYPSQVLIIQEPGSASLPSSLQLAHLRPILRYRTTWLSHSEQFLSFLLTPCSVLLTWVSVQGLLFPLGAVVVYMGGLEISLTCSKPSHTLKPWFIYPWSGCFVACEVVHIKFSVCNYGQIKLSTFPLLPSGSLMTC